MEESSNNSSTTSHICYCKFMKLLSKRQIFLSTFRPQAWSLPDSVIYYITRNPSTPKNYKKLIQTCKYFFVKNPILVVQRLVLRYQNHEWNAKCNDRPFNLKKTGRTKIWATYEFNIRNNAEIEANIFSSIIPRIYQSDISYLILDYQRILFDDLKVIASKAKIFHFYAVTVVNEDDSVVSLEQIIEAFPKVVNIHFNFGDNASTIILPETVTELLKIPNFFNITKLMLVNISDSFDINTFYDFIKQNNTTSIRLTFSDELSQAYKNRLQQIVNEIIVDAKKRNYNVPFINFPGITPSSRTHLQNYYCPR